MPGARACLFSLDERPGPLPLQLEHLHFETLFCLRGSVTLTRQDGSFLKAGAQQVLLLTDLAGFTGANVDAPLEGVLVAVDAQGARESLKSICNLLGGLTLDTGRVRWWISATTFKEEFRRLYGLPVHAWLRQRRMERAAELLHTSGLSLETVAQAVGYSSVSQFAATFRRYYGVTPGKYRKNV